MPVGTRWRRGGRFHREARRSSFELRFRQDHVFSRSSKSDRLNITIHAILRSRAELAEVRLLGNGDFSLPANASRLLTASGRISPDVDGGDCCIHLYTTNDLQNGPSNSAA